MNDGNNPRAGRAKTSPIVALIMIALASCVMLFFVFDRMVGKSAVERGFVTNKTFKTSTVRKNNRNQTKTTYYLDVDTSTSGFLHQAVGKSDYDRFSKGDQVEMTYTIGGVTGTRYFKAIRAYTGLAERAQTPRK
ncbi:MAG TPA: hypothetical protein PLU72_09670 [Candidatus Ozemobacteraceae bacterium]|nr:hypothetical protein [Candidatus Ozemobacteraceae bacterium]